MPTFAVLSSAVSRAGLVGSVINLNNLGHYIHVGVFNISVANIIVICVMLVVFMLAILVPFPHGRSKS